MPFKTKAFKDLSVYMVGNNLWLASKFRGYDPESTRLGTNSVVRGVVRIEYPNARSVTFGVRANF